VGFPGSLYGEVLAALEVVMTWIRAILAALMAFFGVLQDRKVEDTQERKAHVAEVREEVAHEIAQKHEEVVAAADPGAAVDQQLRDLDLVE
jgi:hypothetical protein